MISVLFYEKSDSFPKIFLADFYFELVIQSSIVWANWLQGKMGKKVFRDPANTLVARVKRLGIGVGLASQWFLP